MKNIVWIFIVFGLLQFNFAQSKIYKYKDEEGNIHYSDKKPFADAEEEKLKTITVVESNSVAKKTSWKRLRHKEKPKSEKFEKFSIAYPLDKAVIWGTGGNISVRVNLDQKLPSNYRIKFYMDNVAHGKVKSGSQLIADVIRGPHTLYAEVIDAFSRKVIKTTPTINFHVKQKSKK